MTELHLETPQFPQPSASAHTAGRVFSSSAYSGAVAATSQAGRIRVLLVDDDTAFLEALAALVGRQPELEVTATVSDGIAALDQVEADQPDAVVIDLHMPLLDGISTVARLRRDRPALCLIAVTGDHAPELREAAREAGADEVLLKQELVDALVGRLREALRARRTAT